eukprot:gene25937-31322_t
MSTSRAFSFRFFPFFLMLTFLSSSLRYSGRFGLRKLLIQSPGRSQTSPYYKLSSSFSSKTSIGSHNEGNVDQNISSQINSNNAIWKGQVASAIKAKDIEKIRWLRDEIVASKSSKNLILLTNLIAACEKAADIPIALQIIQDLKNASIALTEATYLPLVRCYIDANDLSEAWKYVKLIAKQDKGLIRHRTLQPLFDYCLRSGEMSKALEVFAYMTNDIRLAPRNDHIALILKIYLKTTVETRKRSYFSTIQELLVKHSAGVWGLTGDELWDLLKLTNPPTSSSGLSSQAILVERAEDLLGAITDESRRAEEGLVRAYNATFTSPTMFQSTNTTSNSTSASSSSKAHPTSSDLSSATNQSTYSSLGKFLFQPSDLLVPADSVTVAEEWFVLAEERRKLLERRAVKKYQEFVRQSKTGASDKTPHLTLKSFLQAELKPLTDLQSNMVCLSHHTPICPQCQGSVKRLELAEGEKVEIRQAILSTAKERGKSHEDNLTNFTHWLESRPPFTYIVDAANVAYSHQNYEQGRFNYHQLDLVVRQLQGAGHRVLTILPSCYAPKSGVYVPNSIRVSKNKTSGDGKGGRSKDKVNVNKLTKEDIAIISRLLREDSVYLVPSGADDDWYWMTASLITPPPYTPHSTATRVNTTKHSNNTSTTLPPAPYVVTNDLMRDHKLSFIAPRPFVRWRAGQIVHFTFAFQEKDNMPAVDNSDGKTDAPSATSKKSDIDTTIKDTNSTTPAIVPILAEKVILFPPGNFTREMQFDNRKKRWHIPALDRNMWLCLEL